MTEIRFEVLGTASPQGEVQVVAPWGGTCRASVSQGKCSIQAASPGTHSLIAIYAGDASNQASVSSAYELTVF